MEKIKCIENREFIIGKQTMTFLVGKAKYKNTFNDDSINSDYKNYPEGGKVFFGGIFIQCFHNPIVLNIVL